ncbi:MAG: hypothetical protein V1850_04505 [Candidatus Bathyarchaeota archaeon]
MKKIYHSRLLLLSFCLTSFVILSQSFQTLPVARASSGFQEDFNDLSLPTNWVANSMHGAYSIGNGTLNLRSADYTPWASISIQSNCTPSDNGFNLRTRVRNNGGYGIYFALFVSNKTFAVSKDGQENAQCTINTIAVEYDYQSFKVCRGTSPTASHWSWFNIASVGTVGNWYILELNVSKNPYEVTANVYNDNDVLLGSRTISDMVLQYSQINVCGVAVWRGVPQGDSLANYDVDWIKGENLEGMGFTYPIRIDKSYVSCERAKIGSIQTVGFHAKWGSNDSDVVVGYLFINGTQYVTNGTGWISFENSFSTVGKKTWLVTSVDCKGVTKFSNFVSLPTIICDSLKMEGLTVTTSIPASIQVSFDVKYNFDSSLVNDADVKVNDVVAKNIGNGRYSAYLPSLMPVLSINIAVERSGFEPITTGITSYSLGNIAVESTPFIILSILVVRMKGRKHRTHLKQLRKILVDEKGKVDLTDVSSIIGVNVTETEGMLSELIKRKDLQGFFTLDGKFFFTEERLIDEVRRGLE